MPRADPSKNQTRPRRSPTPATGARIIRSAPEPVNLVTTTRATIARVKFP
jgi:hypothetical protein